MRFSPVAFAVAAALLGFGFAAGIFLTFGPGHPPGGDLGIVVPAIVGGLFAGFAAARISGGIAFRELLCAVMLVIAVALAFGQFGYARGTMLPPLPDLMFGDVQGHAPGSAYLGPTWARDVVLWLIVAGLQGLVASSLTFMRAVRLSGSNNGGFERMVSLRYLQAKRRDARISKTALIAATGVAFGVAALIAVSSAMTGYVAEVTDRILDTNAHLIIQRFSRDFVEYGDAQQKIQEVPGVVATAPFVFTGGMLSAERGMFPVLIKGVEPEDAAKVSNLRQQLRGADIQALQNKPGELPKMFLGRELYKQLSIKPGDEISLVSPVAEEGKRGAPPRRMRFTVAGHFVSGMNDFDQRLVYVNLDAARQFVGIESGIAGIEVKSADPAHLEDLAARIKEHLGGFPWKSIDWMQLNRGIFSALSMQKMMMQLILLFIVIVAAFNIASTLFMLVVEKTREVAVLKALGAQDGSVMAIFVAEGHVIAGVGIVSGIVLGLLLCFVLSKLHIHIAADVYLIDTLRVDVKAGEVAAIAFGALEIAHLATLYPALKAARTVPVEGLRYG